MKAKVRTWLHNVKNGKLTNTREHVLYHIKRRPGINTDELRSYTTLRHQTLTGAISDLLDNGVIKMTGKQVKKNDSFYSCYEFVSDPAEITQNIHDRNIEKYKSWLKRGLKQFEPYMNDFLEEEIKDELNRS